MTNPWIACSSTSSTDTHTGVRKILTIKFSHRNGYTHVEFNVPRNKFIGNRMDLLFADDYLALTKILIQRLTAKQVPV